MNFHIITIFPKIFTSYFSESIIKRAQKEQIINLQTYDLRDWTTDKHKSVDDKPFGGGPGMLMKIEPLYLAISDIKANIKRKDKKANLKTVLLSAKGKQWNQQKAKKYINYSDIILICGRYEGVDERILAFIDEEMAIGEYILTGGELGAMILVDSITRLLPGVLGNTASVNAESFTKPGVLEYPQYTRPEIFIDKNNKKYPVPKVLVSGNHKKIAKWREKHIKNANNKEK